MDQITRTPARVRTGVVGAYVNGRDPAAVLAVRELAGRVTVTGKDALSTLERLARQGDVDGIDVDPTDHTDNSRGAPIADQRTLFDVDQVNEVIRRQRRLGLAVVRAPGARIRAGDLLALKATLSRPLDEDVVRTLVLDGTWLTKHRRPLLDHVAGHAGPLAVILAAVMDPMRPRGAVEGLCQLLTAAGRGGHRVELLRTDTTGIAFAAFGGTLGAVGVLTSLRHHALPMPLKKQREYQARQTSPLVFLPQLASWQRGSDLSALAPLDDVRLARCSCGPCDGRSLERFATQWPAGAIPREVTEDAVRHDVASWTALAGDVLRAPDPARAWARTCEQARQAVMQLQGLHRIELELPAATDDWARIGSMPSRRPPARRT